MDGMDATLLNATTSTGNDLAHDIMVNAQIFRIDDVPVKDHLGRYNFSTTEEHYLHAITWLDT